MPHFARKLGIDYAGTENHGRLVQPAGNIALSTCKMNSPNLPLNWTGVEDLERKVELAGTDLLALQIVLDTVEAREKLARDLSRRIRVKILELRQPEAPQRVVASEAPKQPAPPKPASKFHPATTKSDILGRGLRRYFVPEPLRDWFGPSKKGQNALGGGGDYGERMEAMRNSKFKNKKRKKKKGR
jgi:hypothetical protein